MWFICALLTTLIWGLAELFYKKSAVENEKYKNMYMCWISYGNTCNLCIINHRYTI